MNSPRHLISAPTVILLLVVVGFLLRGALPSRIAVEHFDEGVYASNLVTGPEYEYRYPSRHLFAPPLAPWLIEWSQVAWGINDLASVAVNLIAGGLTVLLVGFVAARWFNDRAGIAAAALAALSGIHILYSRTALTDPLVCFWMLAAVYAIWCSLSYGDKSWAVIAGLLTGLSWWTKYNGWLPLAIGVAATIPWLFVCRDRARLRTSLVCLAIIIATAGIVWSPVWFNLPDGYAAVAANHRQYLVGLDRWPQTLWQQLLNHRLLEGAFGPLSLAAAVIVVGAFSHHQDNASATTRTSHFWKLSALAVGLSALASLSASSIVLAALAVYWLWRNVELHPTDTPPDEDPAAVQLALWMLIAWIAGLSLTTPLYTAYPRITLPWLVPIWLAGGAATAWLVVGIRQTADESPTATAPRGTVVWAAGIIVVGVAVAIAGRYWNPGSTWSAWQSHTGLADIAAEVKTDIEQRIAEQGGSPRSDNYVVDVYGEPSLFFQLRQLGIELALPASNLRFAQPGIAAPSHPTFLLAGPHALRSSQFKQQLAETAGRLKLLKTYQYTPSDFVLLNQHPPGEIRQADGQQRQYSVRLYQLE